MHHIAYDTGTREYWQIQKFHFIKYARIPVFSDHKVTIKNTSFFVLIVLLLRTNQRKKNYNEQLTFKYSIQWYHMTECDVI